MYRIVYRSNVKTGLKEEDMNGNVKEEIEKDRKKNKFYKFFKY